MGGNALFFKTHRLGPIAYKDIELDVLTKLKLIYPKKRIEAIPYYRSKQTFGDCDILVEKPHEDKNTQASLLRQHFNSKHTVITNSLVHFDYKMFQIDLIYVKPDEYDFTKFYMSYNDLNSFLGILVKQLGITFSSNGLRYKFNNFNEHVLLSDEPKEIYEFIGLDYNIYTEGFNTPKEIFDFILSSKYFNKEIFLPANLTNKKRHRIKKRSMYIMFLDYLKEVNPETKFNPSKNKSEYYDFINDYFPDSYFLEKVKKFNTEEERKRLIKKKFNGNYVKDWFGITGPELGRFLFEFRAFVEKTFNIKFEEWLYNKDEDSIYIYCSKFYQTKFQKYI